MSSSYQFFKTCLVNNTGTRHRKNVRMSRDHRISVDLSCYHKRDLSVLLIVHQTLLNCGHFLSVMN